MAEEIKKHKCFISFKTEDMAYKKYLVDNFKDQMIDKSLSTPIDSDDEGYIMRKIRKEHLSDSTVTIFLIGSKSSEDEGYENQKYIKRELQASLYNGEGNPRSGILGVVLPSMKDSIYKGSYTCSVCGKTHNWVAINDSTVIKEFGRNYYILSEAGKCSWSEDERYCVLVNWEDFKSDPQTYIDKAFNKRSQDIANKVTVYPK